MSLLTEQPESFAPEWARYNSVMARLATYMKTSEQEFAALIEALDTCWGLADNMMEANQRLSVLTIAGGGAESDAVRDSILRACDAFRGFLEGLNEVSQGLAVSARAARGLLGSANRLQEFRDPLRYISFFFRLEGARLEDEHNASLAKVSEEMQAVAKSLTRSGDAQQVTLGAIHEKLMSASLSVDSESATFSLWASEAEVNIQRALDQFIEIPPDLLAAQQRAAALGSQVTHGIQEAAKALQGHDSISQRLQHIVTSLDAVRDGECSGPGPVLYLQRLQTRDVLDRIVAVGASIEKDLRVVIEAASGIAGDKTAPSHVPVATDFEIAVDRIAALRGEIDQLMTREIHIGRLVVGHIVPISELLSARGGELEILARSMKMLALNVLIGAGQMSESGVVAALGAYTSEAAGKVLEISKQLNEEFAELGTALRARTQTIGSDIQVIEASLHELLNDRSEDVFRTSRKSAYNEMGRLRIEASGLSVRTEDLLKSLKFVDEGRELFSELDAILASLLASYPDAEQESENAAAGTGYVMQAQHDVHLVASGGVASTVFARITEAALGDDYGDNVELF